MSRIMRAWFYEVSACRSESLFVLAGSGLSFAHRRWLLGSAIPKTRRFRERPIRLDRRPFSGRPRPWLVVVHGVLDTRHRYRQPVELCYTWQLV